MPTQPMHDPARALATARVIAKPGAARATMSPHAGPSGEDRRHLPVPSPDALRGRRPLSQRGAEVVARARRAIGDVNSGRDDHRLVVVVGPCSIHDRDSALEFARRLADVARIYQDDLLIVMRTYCEKPRTRGGWKGLISDPNLDGGCDVVRGLELAREILVAISELGLPCASEVLDPLVAPYLEDLLSWASIGARTVSSQPHRELASALPMPVGVKNGLDGQIDSAVDALHAIAQPHSTLALSPEGAVALRRSRGNSRAHLVLRGGDDGPNFSAPNVELAARACARDDLGRPVWVDCSHGNSGKDHRLQAHVCRAVLEQLRSGQNAIGGLLLESHLSPGNQTWNPGEATGKPEAGISITDACMGWEETQGLLGEVAASLRTRCVPAAQPLRRNGGLGCR